MELTDDMLMAYADGELAPAQRARVEAAMRDDPGVAAAVERHRALRADVFAAFAGVLDEPVPERLRPAPAAPVRIDALAAAGARPLPARWRWGQAGALAAALVLGVAVGALGWRGQARDAGAIAARAGEAVVAQGVLAQALSTRLAADAAGGAGPVRIGVSFAARDGTYCRSFQLGATGGLACRVDGQWRIPVLAAGTLDGGAGGDGYRQAGSALPAAVLEAIDARIAGAALDAAAERAARDRDWRPAKR